MPVYYVMLVFIILFAYPMCICKPSIIKKRIYVFVVFGLLYLLSVFRYEVGNDYDNYYNIFMRFREVPDFFQALGLLNEAGFSAFNWILSRFTDDVIIINAIYSMIILPPVAYVIYKHSKNVWISCFIYICLTYFYTTLNFTRQSIAASIVLLSFHFIKEKKHWAVMLVVFFASLFHITALVFIPIYLLSLIRPEKYLFAAYGVLTVTAYIIAKDLFDFIAKFVSDSLGIGNFSAYVDSRFTEPLGIHFIILPAFTFALMYFTYHSKWREEEKNSALFVNFAAFTLVFWVIGSKMMIVERFSMFFSIFLILGIPSAVSHFLGNFEFSGLPEIHLPEIHLPEIHLPEIHLPEIHLPEIHSEFNTRRKRKGKQSKNAVYYAIFGVYAFSCIVYHSFGLVKNFHGVVPYRINNAVLQKVSMGFSERSREKLMYDTMLAYEYLSLLLGNDVGIIICGKRTDVRIMDSATRSVFKDIGVEYDFPGMKCENLIFVKESDKVIYENSSAEALEYTTRLYNREITVNTETSEIFVDGENLSLGHDEINFVILYENGEFMDASAIVYYEATELRQGFFSFAKLPKIN